MVFCVISKVISVTLLPYPDFSVMFVAPSEKCSDRVNNIIIKIVNLN